MRYIIPIIILCFLLVSCNQQDQSWGDKVIKSEKDVTMVASINLKKLMEKADLSNNSQLAPDQKIMINAFNATMNNESLGFDIDKAQRFFLVPIAGEMNAAMFMVGDVTDLTVFENTLSSYLGAISPDESYPKIVYVDEYEVVIGYDEDHFIVGYGQNSLFAFQKIETYFKNPLPIVENKMLEEYLSREDDVSYYLAAGKLIEFINKINNPFTRLFLSNIDDLSQYSNNLYAALNFNNGEVILTGNSDFEQETGKSVFANGGVDKQFKNYLSDNNQLILFGFLNVIPENVVNQVNQLSKVGQLRGLNRFLKRIGSDKLIETMDGQMSFSLIDLPGDDVKSTNDNTNNDEDYWNEEGYDVEDDLSEVDYGLDIEVPKMIISIGVKDVEKLKSFSDDNDVSIVDNQITTIDKNGFLLLKNNVLHIATSNELLEKINKEGELKTYTAIEDNCFNKPLYGVMNFDLQSWPAGMVDEIKRDSGLKNALQELKTITFSTSNNELQFKLELNDEKQNSLKRILELIIENQIIEEFI